MSSARAKEIGEEGEWSVYKHEGDLELVGESEAHWFDARDQDGREVEIKVCANRIKSWSSTRRGRILIKNEAHQKLLEADGEYRIGVYGPNRELLAVEAVSADVVDDTILFWTSVEGRTYDEYAQLSWASLIDADVVEEGRHA